MLLKSCSFSIRLEGVYECLRHPINSALLFRVGVGDSSLLCQSLREFLDTMMEVVRSDETICQLAAPLSFITRADFEEGCLESSNDEENGMQ